MVLVGVTVESEVALSNGRGVSLRARKALAHSSKGLRCTDTLL